MGKALFDEAFREYARRWAFRRPEPADFFRTMDDVSGLELAWFWREWFYGVGFVDLGIQEVTHYKMPIGNAPKGQVDPHLAPAQAASASTWYISDKPELRDKYTEMKEEESDARVPDLALVNELMATAKQSDEGIFHVYQVRLKNHGTCLMPMRLQAVYADGSKDDFTMPAQVWMGGQQEFVKLVYSPKEAVAFHLDPRHALPDVDRENNVFPNPGMGLKMHVYDLRE
jgi:hypothetical protein